jgi:hypothetical protein
MIATDGSSKSRVNHSFTIQNLKSKIQNGIRILILFILSTKKVALFQNHSSYHKKVCYELTDCALSRSSVDGLHQVQAQELPAHRDENWQFLEELQEFGSFGISDRS